MSNNKMLIDAAHREETRVVVVRGNRVDEFDFESAAHKQLRGNIYLAKVTRVEPSLQAAFVDYGGNRHGFLAFNEIHPDYYQIPVADRKLLLEQEAADEIAAGTREDEISARDHGKGKNRDNDEDGDDDDGVEVLNADDDDHDEDDDHDDDESDGDNGRNGGGDFESVGQEDALEELPRRATHQRTYKIQEVIKRHQVILIQVVKEERGKKGAALTTYLSLAGRYCVLMPNTARGGGISRKITSPGDRRRLRDIAQELEVPQGTGLIVRTAGANRTKTEIKRDFDYLLRLWENVRDLTLESSAPSLVYEEGSLVKRSIRDLYDKDVDEVLVEGDEAYKDAKAFMRMLMPSHAKNVKPYKGDRPIFIDNRIENQLDAMFSPVVTLKSGGYLVINQTEALVAIDINSGKATRQHNIEDTALNTNLEAADEISRQLRLRDLAGLIVIDFIDMEQRRNNRSVERRMKDRLKNDRARIQVGRISHFGLLEMSRQRMRSGVLEGSTLPCAHCEGRGFVRSVESSALHVLRGIEEHLLGKGERDLAARCPASVALYILNQKRERLLSLEDRYGVAIFVESDPNLVYGKYLISTLSEEETLNRADSVLQLESVFSEDGEDSGDGKRRKRKRGGRRRDRDERGDRDGGHRDRDRDDGRKSARAHDDHEDDADEAARHRNSGPQANGHDGQHDGQKAGAHDDGGEDGERKPGRRRRGRRGGRRIQQRRLRGEAGGEDTGDERQQAHAEGDGRKDDDRKDNDRTGNDGAEAETVTAEAVAPDTTQDSPPEGRKPRRRKARTDARAETGGDDAIASEAAGAPDKAGDGEADKAEKAPKKRAAKKPVKKAAAKAPAAKDGEDTAGKEQAGEVKAVKEKPKKKPAAAKAKPAGKADDGKAGEAEKPSANGSDGKDDDKAAASKSKPADTSPPKTGWWQKREAGE